jgi:D-aspartate ligase
MKGIHNSHPAVILKVEHYGSLGIMRSLGRMGVPVYGIDRQKKPVAASSRYCTRHYAWNLESAEALATVKFLHRVAEDIGERALLIPTSDEMAMLVAEHASSLSSHFIFPAQNACMVQTLCSKKEMYFLARQFGIPVPDTAFPVNRAGVVECGRGMRFPLILKGINGGALERRAGMKMVIVESPEELLRAYDLLNDPGSHNLMVQEHIPAGPDADWIFNGYFDGNSECLMAFTGKKLRQNPVYTGMTSLGICAWNQHIVEITNDFLRAINYKGVIDVDFRYDPRTQSYKILDINPRVGATFRLFVAPDEMDVIRAMYFDLTGRSVPPSRTTDGRKWIVEDKDLLSSYRYFRDGVLDPGEWLASFRGIQEAGYFAADDPAPFLRLWVNHVRKRLFTSGKNESERHPIIRQSDKSVQPFHTVHRTTIRGKEGFYVYN